MEQHNLIDIPSNNGKYSWSNKRVGKSNIKERLDRILIQENIAAVHSSITSKILHTTASDHKLVIIIMGKMENQGLLPFRYSSIWDNNGEISELVKEAWETSNKITLVYLGNKIKNCKKQIKEMGKRK